MILEFIYGTWSCPANNKCPLIICSLHYLYFAISLFAVSLLAMLAISSFTHPTPDKHVSAAVSGSGQPAGPVWPREQDSALLALENRIVCIPAFSLEKGVGGGGGG